MTAAAVQAKQLQLNTLQNQESTRLGAAQNYANTGIGAQENLGQLGLEGAATEGAAELGAEQYLGNLNTQAQQYLGTSALSNQQQLGTQAQTNQAFTASTNLGAGQTADSQNSQRAASVAADRQNTNLSNQNQELQRGEYIYGNTSANNTNIANEQQQQEQEYRTYLQNQQSQANQGVQVGNQQRDNTYGTEVGGANQATSVGVTNYGTAPGDPTTPTNAAKNVIGDAQGAAGIAKTLGIGNAKGTVALGPHKALVGEAGPELLVDLAPMPHHLSGAISSPYGAGVVNPSTSYINNDEGSSDSSDDATSQAYQNILASLMAPTSNVWDMDKPPSYTYILGGSSSTPKAVAGGGGGGSTAPASIPTTPSPTPTTGTMPPVLTGVVPFPTTTPSPVTTGFSPPPSGVQTAPPPTSAGTLPTYPTPTPDAPTIPDVSSTFTPYTGDGSIGGFGATPSNAGSSPTNTGFSTGTIPNLGTISGFQPTGSQSSNPTPVRTGFSSPVTSTGNEAPPSMYFGTGSGATSTGGGSGSSSGGGASTGSGGFGTTDPGYGTSTPDDPGTPSVTTTFSPYPPVEPQNPTYDPQDPENPSYGNTAIGWPEPTVGNGYTGGDADGDYAWGDALGSLSSPYLGGGRNHFYGNKDTLKNNAANRKGLAALSKAPRVELLDHPQIRSLGVNVPQAVIPLQQRKTNNMTLGKLPSMIAKYGNYGKGAKV